MINRLCGAMKKGVWRAITGKCGFRTTSVVRGFAVCALIAVCMAVLALPRNVRAGELPDEGMQNVETELERLLNEYDFRNGSNTLTRRSKRWETLRNMVM